MFLRGHMQNAYVTHDLDKAMEMVANRFGVEKFDRFNPDMRVKTPSGDEPLVTRVASFWAGGLNIEIIEPVSAMSITMFRCCRPTARTLSRVSITSRFVATTRRRCARKSSAWGSLWHLKDPCR